jgi:L-malate glycosyltransferase
MKRIRVLHVIDHLGYGGAPLVVKSLVEAMPTDRIENLVCALRPNARAVDIKAAVVTLECRKYSFATVKAIGRLCAEHEIDIVHAHLQKAIISSLLAAPRIDSALILHEHGAIFRGGTGCVYRWFLRRFGSRARVVVANSQATGSAMRRVLGHGDVPVETVFNAVDTRRFDPARHDPKAARRRLDLADEAVVVGFVGRLDVCKGIDLLLKAARILCQADRRYRFVIVGEGNERDRLERMTARLDLKRYVLFTGLCENPAELMGAFDMGVIPSRREAFGVTAIELMCMGVPVIASPVGGLPEHVQDHQTGILLPRLDAGAIAEAIRELTDDRALREGIVERARAYARRLSGDEQARAMENLYARTIRRQGTIPARS